MRIHGVAGPMLGNFVNWGSDKAQKFPNGAINSSTPTSKTSVARGLNTRNTDASMDMTLELEEVAKADRRKLAEFIKSHHSYVPNASMFGWLINYWVVNDGETVGAISFKCGDLPLPSELHKKLGLPFRIQCKDYYDWSFPIKSFVNNVRYTLIGGLEKNIASKTLALGRRRAAEDWPRRFGAEILCFYTYVGGGHLGTVYIADNWIPIGETKGRLTAKEADLLGIKYTTYSTKQNWRPQVFDDRFKKKIFYRPARRDFIRMTLGAIHPPTPKPVLFQDGREN